MANITCPACGSVGSPAYDSRTFETLGEWQGESVRKCLRCGAGMTVTFGWFRALKTRQIDAAQWLRMQESWSSVGSGRSVEDGSGAVVTHMLRSGEITEEEAGKLRASG